jgi:multiple sugar transport system substrate-binding protein
MKLRKITAIAGTVAMAASLMAGCGNSTTSTSGTSSTSSESTSAVSSVSSDTATGSDTDEKVATSSEGNKSTGNSSSTETVELPEEIADGKDVSVTVFCCYASEDPHGQYVYQYAEDFMKKYPNVKIDVQALSSNDIDTKMTAMAATPDDMPTLFWTSGDHITAMLDMGIVEDLNNDLTSADKEMFANGIVDDVTYDDQMAFYPIDVQPSAVIYRKDWFEEEGIDVPQTWEELREAAVKLTKDNDGDGANDQWGFSMVGSNNSSGQSRFLSYLWSQGDNPIVQDENGNWAPNVSDEKFLKDFSFWTDLYTKDKCVPDSITEVDYQTAANYFAMGYTGMILSGSNALGVAYSSNPDLEGKLGSFVIPGSAPGTMMNSEGYAMYNGASDEQKEAATAFLKFFSINDSDLMFWQSSGKIPATVEGQKASYITGDDYAGFLQTIANGTVAPMNFAGFSGMKTALGDAYSAVFSGEESNEDAVKEMNEALTELVEDYNE